MSSEIRLVCCIEWNLTLDSELLWSDILEFLEAIFEQGLRTKHFVFWWCFSTYLEYLCRKWISIVLKLIMVCAWIWTGWRDVYEFVYLCIVVSSITMLMLDSVHSSALYHFFLLRWMLNKNRKLKPVRNCSRYSI